MEKSGEENEVDRSARKRGRSKQNTQDPSAEEQDIGRRLGAQPGMRNVIGDRVRERREALGLTVDQVHGRLAEQTGGVWNPSRQQVQHIEAKRRAVFDMEVIALAAVLECGAGWLLQGGDADVRPDTRK